MMLNPLQQLQRRTPLGWLQLSRQKSKLLVALSGIAFADVLMFMQLGFQAALFDSSIRTHQILEAEAVIFSPQALNFGNLSTFPRRRLLQAQDVVGVQSAHALYINNVAWKNPQTRQETAIRVLGFAPNFPALRSPTITQQLDQLKLPDRFLFDQSSRGEYQQVIADLQQGKLVKTEIERHTITLAGTFAIGSSFGADGHLITSDQNFLRLFPRRSAQSVSLGLLKLDPQADSNTVVSQLKQHLPNDVVVMTRSQFMEFEKAYWQKNTSIGFIFSMGVGMGFIVGIVIVYQVLSTDVNAHLAEYATFKAMGYGNGYLLSVIFEEAMLLAILGFIPGTVGALGLYALASNGTKLPIFMTLSRAIAVLIMTAIMCMISGTIATRKLQSADPADIF
ncbi:MAG: ABC transporter permease DevC [Synechococcales bacterium]|nr:ABC transporter permease DevC [Synechococcales bacterium]